MSRCRSLVSFEEVLGAGRAANRTLPWELVCDEVVCITTQKGGQKRWKLLKKSLEDADLARLATLLMNERPCDLKGLTCNLIDACFASHFFIIEKAQREKLKRILILEDDVYFDVEALPSAIEACSAFLGTGRPFSAFLFGGVYTEMQTTDIPKIYHGRGMQAHAWLVNVEHPAWGAAALHSGFRMQDVYNHERGQTYMVYPDVAFQRDFATGEQKKNRPVYNLSELPILYQTLTKIAMQFGMQNCWESCARKTNAIVSCTGSIKAALITLGVLVGMFSIAIIFLSGKWLTRKKSGQ